jgi:hypothetical protein
LTALAIAMLPPNRPLVDLRHQEST